MLNIYSRASGVGENNRSNCGADPVNRFACHNIKSRRGPDPARCWSLNVTPLSLPNMTVGNHTLTVETEGYVTSEQTITVVEDRAKQITISLFPASPPLMDTLRA